MIYGWPLPLFYHLRQRAEGTRLDSSSRRSDREQDARATGNIHNEEEYCQTSRMETTRTENNKRKIGENEENEGER